MDKEKFLLNLNLELDTFKAHVNRLKPVGYTIHPLDLELLRKKIFDLYDLVLSFENVPESPLKTEKPETVVAKPKAVTEVPPETTFKKEPVPVEPPLAEDVELEKVSVPQVEFKEEIAILKAEDEKSVAEELIPEPDKPSPEVPEPMPLPEEHKPEVIKEGPKPPKPEPVKTTLDLFSASADYMAEPTVDNSVAGKMQKEKIANIRSAIGINEKFLFLNELFKGDLSRYNRVIDELNAMQTKQGAETYLIELKVAGQWKEDLPAFVKLKEIVFRKY